MRDLQAVILAAGKSSRMAINGTKLLYNFEGKTIIKRVVEACKIDRVSKINIIVGYESEKIISELGDEYNYIFQEEQDGTLKALEKYFLNNNNFTGDLLVMVGDTPLINKEFLMDFVDYFYSSSLDSLFSIVKMNGHNPPYSRAIRSNGKIISILEDFECNNEQKSIDELITSQYCFKSEKIRNLFKNILPKNNGNYYLNDILNLQLKNGDKIDTYEVKDIKTVYGVNDLDDLNYLLENNNN